MFKRLAMPQHEVADDATLVSTRDDTRVDYGAFGTRTNRQAEATVLLARVLVAVAGNIHEGSFSDG